MSWPQNPDDPRRAAPQGPPPSGPHQPPPQQGFGPPPAWPPADGQQQPAPQQPYPPQYQQPPQPPPGYGYPGQQPPYGGAPQGFPAPPPAPRKRRTGLVVTSVVVGVAVVATGVTLLVRHGGDGKHPVAAGPSASSSSTPGGTVARPTPSGQAPRLSGATPKPMIAGWQTQAEASHGFAYDVPPASRKWKVNKVDLDLAYTDQKNNPVVVMSGTAEYHLGGCETAGKHTGPVQAGTGQLATAGEQGSTKGTLQVNARNVAGNWVWAAYGGADGHKPHVTVTDAVPWNHNGIKGYMAKATATGIYRPSACVPATAVSYGISMRLPDGSIGLWVLYADQGVPDALTTAQIKQIMSTVRPYTGS